jgi:hypothetical protein
VNDAWDSARILTQWSESKVLRERPSRVLVRRHAHSFDVARLIDLRSLAPIRPGDNRAGTESICPRFKRSFMPVSLKAALFPIGAIGKGVRHFEFRIHILNSNAKQWSFAQKADK